MATLDGYSTYSRTWEGVGTQFALTVTISVACLSAHEALRRRTDFRHLFSARCYLNKNTSPPPSNKLFGWIANVWRIEETFILHNVGLDAVLYLRFLKMLLQVVMFMLVLVMPILLPIDYINRIEDDVVGESVQEFSITGVGENTYKLWTHTVLNSVTTLFILYLIYRNTVEFVQLRRVHFLKENNDGNPRCRTVMVTNIPDPLCDEDRLRDHFESLGLGEVHCVQLLRYPTKLIEYRRRRKKALMELEMAHTQLAKNLLSALQSGKLEEEVFIQYDKQLEYQELQKYLQDPTGYSNTPCTSELREQLILLHSQDTNTISVWDLLLRLDAAILEPYQPHHRTDYKMGRTRRSIDYWYEKLIVLDRRINLLRAGNTGGGRCGISVHTLVTSTAFVTFSNPASAQLCAQSIIHPSINRCQTYLAPEPKDIIWHNHTLSRSSRISRKLVVNAITWVLIILWLIPALFLLTFLSFDTLSNNYPEIAKFGQTYPWAQTILQNLIPSTFVACFMSALPHTLYYISTMEAWKTHSLCERTTAIRYYYFCIFNVLFLFLLGPSIFSIFIDALNNKYNVIQEFASRIPKGAAFFINFVIFNTCYQFMELLLVACPFFLSIFSWLFPKTPRERKFFERTWSFPFYYYIPNHLLIFVIVLTYATVNPVIIPAGFLYFISAYFVFKNQFVYCYIKQYESNGRIWNLLVRFITDGIIIAQLTTGCIVALRGQYVAVIPLIITLFLTFYFKFYYRKVFRLRLKYVPLVSLKEAEPTPRSSMNLGSPPLSPAISNLSNVSNYNQFRAAKYGPAPNSRVDYTSEASHADFGTTDPGYLSPNRSLHITINNEFEPEDLQGQTYSSQAFSHPALVKPIPTTMLLSKYPLRRRYDLYEDVINVDVVAPTVSSDLLRDIASPSLFSGTYYTDERIETKDGSIANLDVFNPGIFANFATVRAESTVSFNGSEHFDPDGGMA